MWCEAPPSFFFLISTVNWANKNWLKSRNTHIKSNPLPKKKKKKKHTLLSTRAGSQFAFQFWQMVWIGKMSLAQVRGLTAYCFAPHKRKQHRGIRKGSSEKFISSDLFPSWYKGYHWCWLLAIFLSSYFKQHGTMQVSLAGFSTGHKGETL